MSRLNLGNFGKGLKFNKRNISKQETITITEKDLFIETINLLYNTWIRSNNTYEMYKINLLEYEESFYQIIENCLLIKYDLSKTEIILWYIFGREDDEGNILPLILQFDGKDDEELIISDPSDLWNLLERLDNEK
jgi:hypothetical protein